MAATMTRLTPQGKPAESAMKIVSDANPNINGLVNGSPVEKEEHDHGDSDEEKDDEAGLVSGGKPTHRLIDLGDTCTQVLQVQKRRRRGGRRRKRVLLVALKHRAPRPECSCLTSIRMVSTLRVK